MVCCAGVMGCTPAKTQDLTMDDLYNALDELRPGAEVKVRVLRGNAIREVKLKLMRIR